MYLYFKGQGSNFIDVPEKYPKHADLKWGGGIYSIFLKHLFLFILDRPKPNIIRLSPWKIPPLVTIIIINNWLNFVFTQKTPATFIFKKKRS